MRFMWFNMERDEGADNKTKQDEGHMKRENNSSRHQTPNIISKGNFQWREGVQHESIHSSW